MSRVKRGVTTHARHRKVIKAAKGYYGRRKTPSALPIRQWKKPANMPIATARPASAISAASGSNGSMPPPVKHGMTYGRFIHGLGKAGIEVDRKVLADLAVREPGAFKALVDQAEAALA